MTTKNTWLTLALCLSMAMNCFSQNLCFKVSTYPLTTAGPANRTVVAADFNGDTYPDLVAANITSSLDVFINNGNGTYASAVAYTLAGGAHGISCADVDKDGDQDIVCTLLNDQKISVSLNNGNGTFAAAVNYTAPFTVTNVTTADFNNDTYPDIAVACLSSGKEMLVFMNTGTGSFNAYVTYTGTATSFGIVATHVNADQYPDLVTSCHDNGAIDVFINNGNGTFASAVNYSASTPTANTFSVDAGDFNSDGYNDIVLVRPERVTVYICNQNGSFTSGVNYTITSADLYGVKAGDVNGDGKADVVAASVNSTSVYVLLNNGDGTLGTATTHDMGAELNAVTIANTDKNGNNEIISGSEAADLRILENLTAKITPAGPISSCLGEQVILTANANGYNYSWSSTTTSLSENTNTLTLNGTVISATTYTVTLTDQAGTCTSSASVGVSFNGLPNVTLAALAAVCDNAGLKTLSGGSPLNGVYSGTGVSAGQFNPSAGTQTITYTYTDANGCHKSASQQQVVNTCTNVLSSAGNEILTFPVPNQGVFDIAIEEQVEEIVLIDVTGKEQRFASAHIETNMKGKIMVFVYTGSMVYKQAIMIY